MGRVTPSWRTIYHRTIDRLRRRKSFYRSLRAKHHQESFNQLLRVLGRESTALSNANIPAMMYILNLMANVHAKRQLEALKQEAEALREQLQLRDQQQ